MAVCTFPERNTEVLGVILTFFPTETSCTGLVRTHGSVNPGSHLPKLHENTSHMQMATWILYLQLLIGVQGGFKETGQSVRGLC